MLKNVDIIFTIAIGFGSHFMAHSYVWNVGGKCCYLKYVFTLHFIYSKYLHFAYHHCCAWSECKQQTERNERSFDTGQNETNHYELVNMASL